MDISPFPRHEKYDQKSVPVVCSLDEDDDEIDAVALPGVPSVGMVGDDAGDNFFSHQCR